MLQRSNLAAAAADSATTELHAQSYVYGARRILATAPRTRRQFSRAAPASTADRGATTIRCQRHPAAARDFSRPGRSPQSPGRSRDDADAAAADGVAAANRQWQAGRDRDAASPAPPPRGRSPTGGRRNPSPARPAAQLRGKPQRMQRPVADGDAADPFELPDTRYQPLRMPGSVGRQDVAAAITAAGRWEEVAAVVDNRDMDPVTLAAAFGHLAKLHAAAGAGSDVPHAIKASGLLERMTQRAVTLAGSPGPFPGRNVAAVLAACARLGVNPGEPALHAISAAAARNLRSFSPGHAANAVRAFGTLRFRPQGSLLADLAEVALQGGSEGGKRNGSGGSSGGGGGKLSPYNVGSLAWGYARLCAHPGGRLLQALEGRVSTDGDKFKAAHVADTLWGFGTLGHAPAGTTLRTLLGLVLESGGRDPPHGFSSATAAGALSGLAKLGVWPNTGRSLSSGGNVSGGGGSGGSGRSGAAGRPPAAEAAAETGSSGGLESDALRVLAEALAAGAGDLNATQLAQALAALALLPSGCVAPARDPLLSAVAAKAPNFPPHLMCKAMTAMEALAPPALAEAAAAAAEAATAVEAVEAGQALEATAAASKAAPPAGGSSRASVRRRLAAMQTVEDQGASGSGGAATVQEFVASLSRAQQALTDAEMAAEGSASSGEDNPAFASSDDEDVVEGFLLDGGFALSLGGGDPAAAEAPEHPGSTSAAAGTAATKQKTPAEAALTALARQLRLTARRFEPPAMLAALRSFAALAEGLPQSSSQAVVSPAAPAGAAGAAPTPDASAAAAASGTGFLLPADVLGALGSDILARRLQFSRVQRGEAAALLGRLAAARGVGLTSVQALAQAAQP